jgi:hypothetical protein
VQRRKGLVVASASVVTAFAVTTALGANFGLFGLTQRTSDVGSLRPAAQTVPAPSTVPTTTAPPTSVPAAATEPHTPDGRTADD